MCRPGEAATDSFAPTYAVTCGSFKATGTLRQSTIGRGRGSNRGSSRVACGAD